MTGWSVRRGKVSNSGDSGDDNKDTPGSLPWMVSLCVGRKVKPSNSG